jgi:hypothetical protein
MSHQTQYKYLISGLLLGALMLFPPVLKAQSGIEPTEINRVGQSGWQFLKINGDPKQAALGGSMMATHFPGPNVLFGSPAMLTLVKGTNVQFNSQNWIADIQHHSMAFSQAFNRIGTFALSLVVLDYGDIPETIHMPLQGGGTAPVVTGNMFTAKDVAVGLSFARSITAQLSLGGTVRYINETIAATGMSNWAVDFSTFYYTGFRSLRMSIAARNFGPDTHLVGYNEELQSEPVDVRMPLELRAGVAYDILEKDEDPHLLTVMSEGKVSSDGPEKVHLGAEYMYNNMLSFRMGYKFNYDEEGLTLGAGINFPIGQQQYSLNYAYLDFGNLTNVQMLSLGWTIITDK